jgi:NIMA (never in mitosis gene a)-related kinase
MNNDLQTSLNDFKILQEIGKGAFGSVFKVKRIIDGEIYALKKVPMEKLKPKEKENSLNEIRILASIRHPNVISYKDAFFDYNSYNLCIVMEYADCGDLENKINSHIKNKKHIEEKEILRYFIQIVQGLKALHDKKIIHRDIKAANIFLFNSNLVKIGDLNVSKVFKPGVNFTQTGTPYYASPEVWCDKPYDYKADIWSLGCLLYEMLTLKAPFRGNTMKAVFDKVMKGVYEPIPAFYSNQLEDILKMTLQKNPENRPTCDQIFKMTLNKKIFNPLYLNYIKNGREFKNFKTEENENYCIKEDKNDDTQISLLETIKIPNRIFHLNRIMPKSQYKKRNHSYVNIFI